MEILIGFYGNAPHQVNTKFEQLAHYFTKVYFSPHHPNQRTSTIPINTWQLIWKVKLPLKILTFIWKILHDNLPTFSILNNKGILANNKCLMCNEKEETINHLFLQCPFVASQPTPSQLNQTTRA